MAAFRAEEVKKERTVVIWENETTAIQITTTTFISFRLCEVANQQTGKTINVCTVNSLKAKRKKIHSVIPLLNNNKRQQSQYSQKHNFLVFRFCHGEAKRLRVQKKTDPVR